MTSGSSQCCGNYAPIRDPVEDEEVCKNCGAVNEQETEVSRHLDLEESTIAQMQAEDHNVSSALLLVENGTPHSYMNDANKGLTFRLGTKMLAEPYVTGLIIERNVRIEERKDGTYRAIVDYKRDKSYIRSRQFLFQLAVKRGLEPYQAVEANREWKRLYSSLIIGIIPELIAEIAYCKATSHERNSKYHSESETRINELKEDLRSAIMVALQKAELIEAPLGKSRKKWMPRQ